MRKKTKAGVLASIRCRLEERVNADAAQLAPCPDVPNQYVCQRHFDYERIRAKALYVLTIGSPEDAVREAYRILFGREPDHEGLKSNVARLRYGFSKRAMLAELAESHEGRQAGVYLLAAELKRQPPEEFDWGALERYGGADFVSVLYRTILKTDPDSRSVARWTALLELRLLTKREIIESLLQTNEALALRCSSLKGLAQSA